MRDKVKVPARGRFVVIDGKVYRVVNMWVDSTASDRVKWGLVAERKEAV